MNTYTIELTDTEKNAFLTITNDPLEWIKNAAKERCRIAIDDIVSICVKQCLDTGTPIPGSKEDMVALALERGWVKTL